MSHGLPLKRKESVAEAGRRLTCERITHAIDRLHQPDRVEAIHGARKDIKKTRAVLRLLRRPSKNGPATTRWKRKLSAA